MAAKSRAQTMEDNRGRLIEAARAAFAAKGFAGASMDDLTAAAGLTRGALYHNFGDKTGLLAAVVAQVDGEMAERARADAVGASSDWEALVAEGTAYIGMALDPEVRRIVLLDGPAFLGDPSRWPSQNACLALTRDTLSRLVSSGTLKAVDVEAAARLISGAALNAALWVAASENPTATLPKAVRAFEALVSGLLADRE